MYLYTFENHKCPKSAVRADKNELFKKHQKSPILAGFACVQMKFKFHLYRTFLKDDKNIHHITVFLIQFSILLGMSKSVL